MSKTVLVVVPLHCTDIDISAPPCAGYNGAIEAVYVPSGPSVIPPERTTDRLTRIW
jgi:hypothetical protein